MARKRQVIRNMPLRGSLVTAGQQGTIPENALWQARNCTSGLDGLLSKRPGLVRWGQTLKQPIDTNAFSFYETCDSMDNFYTVASSAETEPRVANNKLQLFMPANDSAELSYAYRYFRAESDSDDFTARCTIQAVNASGDYLLAIGMRAQNTSTAISLRIRTDRIDWSVAGDDILATMISIGDKKAFSLEVRHDADANTTLYIDDVLVSTIASSTLQESDLYDGTCFSFYAYKGVADAGGFTIYVSDIMMDGSADGLDVERLGAGIDFKTIIGGPAARRYLLVAGTRYVYRDIDLHQFWSPLLALVGGNVSFSQFKDDLLIFDSDNGVSSWVWRWNGTSSPTRIDDAPDVRFGTEHRSRVFAAGDKNHPLRVSFTAANDPTVWFSPETDADGQETVDEITLAGYLTIPGEKGDEVTGLRGEYYGSCIVTTNRGIWRITGSSPQSFAIENIATSVGASAQAAIERMGNDLWLAGRQGISTIQTVQQFGDMQAGMPSAPISDLWAQGTSNSSIKVDQFQLYKSSMAWNPTLSLMYFAFARQGASDVSSILVYNPVTQGWYGPWESDTTFVTQVEVGNPITQVIMHGTASGRVGLTDPGYKTDFGENYTLTLESPLLCGRSVNPDFTHRIKTWKTLRLFFQVRGAWPIEVRWKVDNESYQSVERTLNVFNLPRLGTDWRLNVDPDGSIYSSQLIGVIEIPLDVRGRYLKFDISTTNDTVGEDFALQGAEVEFTTAGFEEE